MRDAVQRRDAENAEEAQRRPGEKGQKSARRKASLAGQGVPALLEALGEAWFGLGGREFGDGQRGGVLQGWRRRGRVAGVVAREADGDAKQRVFAADTLAVFFFEADGEARV